MISIATPTNNPKFILELYESIKAQTYQDWEWIIVTNGGAVISPEVNDSRVRIIPYTKETKSIGELKSFAFSQATGEIVVEIDHDDLITPDCLQEVATAFSDTEVGFVYSNNAKYTDNFTPYNKFYGWEEKTFEWGGKEYHSMTSFEPSATSFSFIWYMPDHVRAWRKSVYDSIGGHNPNLEVLDDQELMLRTYLTTKVKFIDKTLYLYRITGENTWLKRNALIQEQTVKIYHQYAYQIAERWSDLNGLKKVDLCGGINKPQGYTSLDRYDADVCCDLNEGIPLEDNSVGILRAHDAIEHLKDPQKTMAEAWRVLADGGMFMIMVPSTDGRGAFQDPTHISFWNENSFWYWTRKEQAKYIRNDKIKFQAFRLETVFPSEWHRKNNIPYVVAYLSAIKSGKRRPHPQLI